MAQNLFSIKDQSELNGAIHRTEDNCTGDCEWCSKFHKTVAIIAGADMTLESNVVPVGSKGHFLVWCNACSDGVNDTFWEACHWASQHSLKRHSH